MTEESLQHLSIEELYALMVTAIDDYLSLSKIPEVAIQVETKRAELELIQEAITVKKLRKTINRIKISITESFLSQNP